MSNMALGRPTWQTTTHYIYPAGRAVDGNRATYMSSNDPNAPNSCIHTTASGYPVWAVDLGIIAEVHFVEVVTMDRNRKYSEIG